MKIKEIEVGMSASHSQTITEEDIESFAKVSGDYNPIHMCEEYAKHSRFNRRIAHGMISASFFSALFATKIPGKGSIYVSQSLNFIKPVFLGDTVIATVKVIKIDLDRQRVFFETFCQVENKIVINGTAEIYVPNNEK